MGCCELFGGRGLAKRLGGRRSHGRTSADRGGCWGGVRGDGRDNEGGVWRVTHDSARTRLATLECVTGRMNKGNAWNNGVDVLFFPLPPRP